MSALSGAAAVIGDGFVSSLGEALMSLWVLIPVAGAVLMAAASVFLRFKSSRVPFPAEPLAATQPMNPGEVEVGDDTLAMLRRAREQDQAESDAELDREIDDMIARYKR